MTVMPSFLKPRADDPRLRERRRFKMLIDGKSVSAEDGSVIERESPAHPGVIVSEIPRAGMADVEKAVAAARRAFDEGSWPRMAGAERARLLAKVSALILDNLEELATIECLEIGKAISQARGEVAYSADLWSFAAGHARGQEGTTHNGLGTGALGLVLREPVGVVGIITPWNFPLIIGSERIPWALGAGCTVVVKPSEFTSGSTIRLAELARDAGIPDGVINVVTGFGDPVGQAFAEHADTDMVSFTGSQRVGQIVGAKAGARIKRMGLELGGKGPQIVFADADLDAAADVVARSIFGCAGQACISGSRLIVEDRIADELVGRIAALAEKVVVGDPLDERTKVGSLIHAQHLAKVEHYVAEGRADGAEIVVGGHRLGEAGCFYAPTVFAGVSPKMSIARDEIFGPVLSVIPFKNADQAVAIANDTLYGLSASVWSRDLEKAIGAIRRVRAGRTWINGAGDGTAEMPISGFKQSGIGRELGRLGFDEYSNFKNVYMVLDTTRRWIS